MLPTHAPREQPLDAGMVGETGVWAEEHGFDSVWVGDHIVHPWQFLEALISLAYTAGRTRRIALGTCVLLLPMRQLSIVTSQIATLATLSGGRLRLGVGIGGEWPREWEAAGVPTSERGARLNESLPLLRKLLAGTQVDFAGRFNVLSGVSVSPVPPRVPIYLAGRAAVALERVGREGDGWIGFFLTPNGFRRDSAAIDEARQRAGRETQPFERGMLLNFQLGDDDERACARALELNLGFAQELQLAGSSEQLKRFALAGRPATVLARLREYVAAGCTTFCVAPMEKDNAGFQRQIRRFAAEVLPQLRD